MKLSDFTLTFSSTFNSYFLNNVNFNSGQIIKKNSCCFNSSVSEYSSFDFEYSDLNLVMNKINFNISEHDLIFLDNLNTRIDRTYIIDTNSSINLFINEFCYTNEFVNVSIECIDICKFNNSGLYFHDIYFVCGYCLYKNNILIKNGMKIIKSLDKINIDSFKSELTNHVIWSRKDKNKFEFSYSDKILFSNKASGFLFHECIGHFLELDNFKVSPIRFFENHNIFSSNLNVYENYNTDYSFDDLISPITKNIHLIKEGILRDTIVNSKYAYLYNSLSTGNCVFTDIDLHFSPRMRHMFIEPGCYTFENLLSNVSKGILVKSISLGEVDVFSGNFSILVDKAYIIESGSITKPLEEFRLFFNVKEFFDFDIKIGDDLYDDISLCGKGISAVKVMYSSPSILFSPREVL